MMESWEGTVSNRRCRHEMTAAMMAEDGFHHG